MPQLAAGNWWLFCRGNHRFSTAAGIAADNGTHPANEFRQLGEFAAIRRASSEVRRRAPSRLLLEIDVGERVAAGDKGSQNESAKAQRLAAGRTGMLVSCWGKGDPPST